MKRDPNAPSTGLKKGKPLHLSLPDEPPADLHFRVLPDGRYELTLAGYFPVVVEETLFAAYATADLKILCQTLTAYICSESDDNEFIPPPAGYFVQAPEGGHVFVTLEPIR